MAQGPRQDISNIYTAEHSQTFAGSFRDIYLSAKEDSQTSYEREARRCRNALAATNPKVVRESLISRLGVRVPGTFEWIADNDDFQAWQSGDSGSRLLWISGGPATGKTTLAIYLTEELQRCTVFGYDLVFFFNESGHGGSGSAVDVLRSLVHQMITLRPDLVKHALPYFEDSETTRKSLASLETLWVIFQDLVQDADLGNVLCVVDGLDQCEESGVQQLVPKLTRLLAVHSPDSPVQSRFCLLIVSDHINGLYGCPRIRLDDVDNAAKIAEDIKLFIKTRTRELYGIKGVDDGLVNDIQIELLEREEVTYQWISRAVKDFLGSHSVVEVREKLSTLIGGWTIHF
ncbi:unnamed protein product [Periconia digitata]|uniref:Nephrocystin 3-like N-terminal domain-containing protein n=1 Tax=Periconia digitata TaxID=1303443 RepID=A0A9W4UFD7_9PLEO|nr:unnamed protein product [Periconia digitata]